MAHELLLILQDLRLSSPDFLTDAMLLISSPISHTVIPLAIASVFLWCSDRRKGDWMMMSIVSGMFFGHLLKDIIKNPRPFVTDDRLILEERAAKGAQGYSTPSGHTVEAVTAYGSVIALVRRWWMTVLMCTVIAAIMFSRLYLGVHTVFDLIIGLIVAIAVMAVNYILISYSYRGDGNCLRVTVIYLLSFIIAVTVWMLITDYHGGIMKYGGLFLGAVLGRQISDGFMRGHSGPRTMKEKVERLAIGWPVTLLISGIPFLVLGHSLGYLIGGFLCSMSLYVFIPAIFLSLKSKNEQRLS